LSVSRWREEKNERALARLQRAMPALFPAPVLQHALSRSLIPPTPRLAVESYWRHHPLRADRLARGLAARSGAPEGWTWRTGAKGEEGMASTFRAPPAPYREKAHNRGPGHCCVCGQPVFRLGWHRDLWAEGRPNKNATWHSACVTAWKLWTVPGEFVKPLKAGQQRRCIVTGKRLMRTAEVDHRLPLYRVWRDHRDLPWPQLLRFWGVQNLQVINRPAHVDKCAEEAGERARARVAQERREID
jgi:hypothetical protein